MADSAYRYVVAGNFFNDSLTSALLINPSGMFAFSYYYVDNVCVSTDSLGCSFCDDNNACTLDTLVNGQFVSIPIICNDNDACTFNTCDSLTGCIYEPLNCDDGNLCNIYDCNSLTGCFYNAVDCSDSNVCTKDACDSLTGCFYSPLSCDDNNDCTIDTCDLMLDCIYTLIECDDGDSCTIDLCDSFSGCFSTPIVNCSVGLPLIQPEYSPIYPNPSSGHITIEIFGSWDYIDVYNLLGQRACQLEAVGGEEDSITIDLSTQPSGVYIVTIGKNKARFAYKIFINH